MGIGDFLITAVVQILLILVIISIFYLKYKLSLLTKMIGILLMIASICCSATMWITMNDYGLAVMVIFSISIVSGILILGISFGPLIVIKPVKELLNVMKEIETPGDLSKRATITSKGEMGEIATYLNNMLDVECNVMYAIKTNADQIASAAKELSLSAEEVNTSMEGISSTMQQITTGSQNTAKNSEVMLNKSRDAVETSNKGKQAVGEVGEKMQLIKTSTLEGNDRISALDEKSEEIGDIVNTINQISEQTNLLALNAAIEAARAGEAGRGFAVVADEVGKLADESKQATQRISELIQGMQMEIDSTVKIIGANAKQIEEGSRGVKGAVAVFEALPQVISGINNTSEEISAVAQQNASGTQEVSASVQEAVSNTQQISSSAEQLASIAEDMKNLANRFKFSDFHDLSIRKKPLK